MARKKNLASGVETAQAMNFNVYRRMITTVKSIQQSSQFNEWDELKALTMIAPYFIERANGGKDAPANWSAKIIWGGDDDE